MIPQANSVTQGRQMTDEDKFLSECRERAEKAVPRSWTYRRDGTDRIIEVAHEDGCDPDKCAYEATKCVGGHVVFREDSRPHWANRLHDESNWEFIAHARTDIPRLLSIIQRQAQRERELREVLTETRRRIQLNLAAPKLVAIRKNCCEPIDAVLTQPKEEKR